MLEAREQAILERLVMGLTVPRIAQDLGRPRGSVKDDLRTIYRVLGVPGREDAVLEAIRRGWATAGREWRGIGGGRLPEGM